MDDDQKWEIYKALELDRAAQRKRLEEAYQYNNNRLEKFILDNEYKNQLVESSRMSQLCVEYYELQKLIEFEKKVKEKLKIPSNANIRYDKVKCSKTCKHSHKYFYAYFWDSGDQKLKKKYIGKNLPETI